MFNHLCSLVVIIKKYQYSRRGTCSGAQYVRRANGVLESKKSYRDNGKKTQPKSKWMFMNQGSDYVLALEEGEMYICYLFGYYADKVKRIDVCEKIRTEFRNEDLQINKYFVEPRVRHAAF